MILTQSQGAQLRSVCSEPGFVALREKDENVFWLSHTASQPASQQPAGESECWEEQEALAKPRAPIVFLPGDLSRNLYLDLIVNLGVWNLRTVGILSQCSYFDVGFTICPPDRAPCGGGVRKTNGLRKCVWSKITWVLQQWFRMLLPSLYEPRPSSQRGWPMKPWDSARALQVCSENPDKFILGELRSSVLKIYGDVLCSKTHAFSRNNLHFALTWYNYPVFLSRVQYCHVFELAEHLCYTRSSAH